MDPHVAWPVAMQGEGARHEVRHEAEAEAEDVDFEAKGWDATRTMEGMAQAARWDASDGLQRERR